MASVLRLAWFLGLCVVLWSCVGCGEDASGSHAISVTGRLIDAETGQAVSRRTVYVHGFNDAIHEQVSLEPEEKNDFVLSLPGPEIRLRVADLEHEYELYEQTFTAKGGALEVEVLLEPSHWIRLHGTVRWRDAAGRLRPLKEGDGNVRHAVVSVGPRGLDPGDDGAYEIRVPRELLSIRSINTNRAPAPREIDLRGELGDAYRLDLILE